MLEVEKDGDEDKNKKVLSLLQLVESLKAEIFRLKMESDKRKPVLLSFLNFDFDIII